VVLVADNAGRELVADLLLVDRLLADGAAGSVALHVKPYPYFVSDAVTADVLAAVRRLAATGAGTVGQAAGRLDAALRDGRLTVAAHPFHCAPLPFGDAPDDLAAEFASALTLVKGDLNYRRLVGDRYTPAATPFAAAVGYFPGPVAALRTLKSEVVVGVAAERAERLDAAGDGWRVGGTHGLVQARL
jgi:hypothetical protein